MWNMKWGLAQWADIMKSAPPAGIQCWHCLLETCQMCHIIGTKYLRGKMQEYWIELNIWSRWNNPTWQADLQLLWWTYLSVATVKTLNSRVFSSQVNMIGPGEWATATALSKTSHLLPVDTYPPPPSTTPPTTPPTAPPTAPPSRRLLLHPLWLKSGTKLSGTLRHQKKRVRHQKLEAGKWSIQVKNKIAIEKNEFYICLKLHPSTATYLLEGVSITVRGFSWNFVLVPQWEAVFPKQTKTN